MKLEMDAPTNAQSDLAILDKPGKYHCRVDWIEEEPRKTDGTMIDNALFRAHCVVLDGTVPGQRDKELNLMFFGPKMTDKDNGEMARAKVRNFAAAIGCLELNGQQMVIAFGPDPGAADYNEGDEHIGSLYARNRQYVCEVEMDREGKYVTLRYSNVWHVDNPVCKDVPKCKEHLKLLPPSLRKTAKDFAKPGDKGKDKGTGGAAGTAAKTPPTAPTGAAGGSAGVSVDDI